MNDILADKSESEIRRAAAWWFTAQEAYCRGEHVPLNIFLLSVRDLTADDIAFAKAFVNEAQQLGYGSYGAWSVADLDKRMS